MFHYIYRIDFLCGEPNRYYIGKHSSTNKTTANSYTGSGLFCKRYFKKYGKEGTYKKTILEVNSSKEENSKREEYWIGDLWQTDPLCMNECPGGQGGNLYDKSGEHNPMFGKKHSEETKAKIGQKSVGRDNGWKGKKHTKESLIKMSENNGSHRDEVRKKISETRKSLHINPSNKGKHKVWNDPNDHSAGFHFE